ncbi:MAG: N-acyl homoserine lactonase family protein, partial [Betaproteobacteria bacterium]
MSDPTYEIYAVRYAHHDRRASENFIGGPFAGDAHDGPMPLDYFVWVIKAESGKLWAVDTGFDAAMAKKREREFLADPAETLRRIGIDAGKVGDVVFSHMH